MLTETARTRDFPTLSGRTYLNTAAEGIPPPSVGEALAAYARDKGLGMKGREPHFARLAACREVSARLVGLKPDEVAFCSCSSEAYNLLASALQLKPGDEVVITDLDFPAGATPSLAAAEKPAVRLWRSREGALDPADLAPLLNERTRQVQVSLVSFYNGHRLAWRPFRDAVRRLAPNAIISVDVTQALGRVVLDCAGADILISSTHKWTLGVHGGCIVGIPAASAERLTTRAGGWHHLQNPFGPDRLELPRPKAGAASFAVGMPNFPAIYALDAALRYLEGVGLAAIAAHADPLVAAADAGLRGLGLAPLCAWDPANPSGILAFPSRRSAELHAALEQDGIATMHPGGRIRVSVHGYNTADDIARLLRALARVS